MYKTKTKEELEIEYGLNKININISEKHALKVLLSKKINNISNNKKKPKKNNDDQLSIVETYPISLNEYKDNQPIEIEQEVENRYISNKDIVEIILEAALLSDNKSYPKDLKDRMKVIKKQQDNIHKKDYIDEDQYKLLIPSYNTTLHKLLDTFENWQNEFNHAVITNNIDDTMEKVLNQKSGN